MLLLGQFVLKSFELLNADLKILKRPIVDVHSVLYSSHTHEIVKHFTAQKTICVKVELTSLIIHVLSECLRVIALLNHLQVKIRLLLLTTCLIVTSLAHFIKNKNN